MTDLDKSVDVVVEDRKMLNMETACNIIENAEGYMSELIAKQLGYEYGRGYMAGFNNLQDVCRTLAAEVVELRVLMRTRPAMRTELDPTAKAFVQEAENVWEVSRQLSHKIDKGNP